MAIKWTRYYKTFQPTKGKKVDKLECKIVAEDFSGTIWFTDLMLQDGAMLTGHIPNTREMHLRRRDDSGDIIPKQHFNAVIRGQKSIVIPNRGTITTAIDFTLYPKDSMPEWTVGFSHGWRTRTFVIGDALSEGDVYEFHASTRWVALNGQRTYNYAGFYHQCPAGDAKFNVDLPDKKSARLLVELEEWVLGIGGERL